MSSPQMVVVVSSKNLGLAIILTILFGGLGLLYASVVGGIIIGSLEIIAFFFALLTFGLGGVLFIPIHFTAVIWAVIAVTRHNRRIVGI